MSEHLEINNVALVPASEVGRAFGYTTDYITRLAREGKIAASKIGRQWFVSENSVRDFFEQTKLEKEKRQKELSAARKQERAQAELTTPRVTSEVSPEEKTSELVQTEFAIPSTHVPVALAKTALVLVLGVMFGSYSHFATPQVSTVAQQQTIAAAAAAELSFLERIAYSLYVAINPQAVERVVSTPSAPTIPTTSVPPTVHESAMVTSRVVPIDEPVRITEIEKAVGLIVLPSDNPDSISVAEIERSFSDEVRVSIDPADPTTGMVVPEFKSGTGDEYYFSLVEVDSSSDNSYE